MNPLIYAVTANVFEFNGWDVSEDIVTGTLRLENKEFPEVEILATPNWNREDTVGIVITRPDGNTRSVDVPVVWRWNEKQDAALWQETLQNLWPQIIAE